MAAVLKLNIFSEFFLTILNESVFLYLPDQKTKYVDHKR